MNMEDAAGILRKMRETAPYGEEALQAVLFGIKYHVQIRTLDFGELSSKVGMGPETCKVELEYGVKLAKYVSLVENR